MKKSLLVKIVSVLLVFICIGCSASVAEGKLKVVTKNLIVFDGKDSGRFYAKVQNNTDKPVGADSGDLVVFSEDDDIIMSKSYVTTLPSYVVLQPGEYLYINEFLWDKALQNSAIGDYKFSISTRETSKTIERIPCEASFELNGVDSYKNYVYVTFTNPTDAPLYGCFVSAALFDAEGNILFADAYSMGSVAVHPEGTVTVKVAIDNDLIKYYNMNNLEPTSVDAMVCYFDE